MAILVDAQQCIGCGVCVDIYPELFSLQKDGKARAYDLASYNSELAETVIEECPVGAIREIE